MPHTWRIRDVSAMRDVEGKDEGTFGDKDLFWYKNTGSTVRWAIGILLVKIISDNYIYENKKMNCTKPSQVQTPMLEICPLLFDSSKHQ